MTPVRTGPWPTTSGPSTQALVLDPAKPKTGDNVKWDKLRRFATAYKRICEIVTNQPGPFIYRVTYADKVIPVRRF